MCFEKNLWYTTGYLILYMFSSTWSLRRISHRMQCVVVQPDKSTTAATATDKARVRKSTEIRYVVAEYTCLAPKWKNKIKHEE